MGGSPCGCCWEPWLLAPLALPWGGLGSASSRYPPPASWLRAQAPFPPPPALLCPPPQVFVADTQLPGRFRLAAERPTRPGGEDLDLILMDALGLQGEQQQQQDGGGGGGGGEGGSAGQGAASALGQLGVTVAGLSRFMRSLSR